MGGKGLRVDWSSQYNGIAVVIFGLCIWSLVASRPQRRVSPQGLVEPPVYTVDLNIATASELLSLPDVGPKLARQIIQFRDRTGAFKDFRELGQVAGIGPAKMERMLPFVSVANVEGIDSEAIYTSAVTQVRE